MLLQPANEKALANFAAHKASQRLMREVHPPCILPVMRGEPFLDLDDKVIPDMSRGQAVRSAIPAIVGPSPASIAAE